MIDVVGFPWCKDTPKSVGLPNLTAKILCRTHNNALSPLDAAAGEAFDALRRASALFSERGAKPRRHWDRIRFEIPKPWLLERWFLKTTLNLCVVSESTAVWRQTGRPLTQPPENLVRLAFGIDPFVKPMGLYSAAAVGEKVYLADSFTFAPLLYGDKESGGQGMMAGLFTFRGFRFLLHLEPHQLPATLEVPGAREPRWNSGGLQYHLQRINWNIGKKSPTTFNCFGTFSRPRLIRALTERGGSREGLSRRESMASATNHLQDGASTRLL